MTDEEASRPGIPGWGGGGTYATQQDDTEVQPAPERGLGTQRQGAHVAAERLLRRAKGPVDLFSSLPSVDMLGGAGD